MTSARTDRLHCQASGDGPPLVLIHGLGCTCRFWEDVVPALEGSFRCLAVDVPGFGRSAPPSLPLAVPGLAGAVLDWLSSVELERVVVVGHSLGGMIAQELAISDPDRVRALVLCSTIPRASERVRAVNEAMASLVEQHGAPALAESLLPAMLGPDELDGTARARERFLADFGSSQPKALADALRAIAGFDATDRLPALRPAGLPTLVVAGEGEIDLDAQRELAASMGTDLVVLAGAGHLAPAESPSAFTTTVKPFLEGLRSGGTWT